MNLYSGHIPEGWPPLHIHPSHPPVWIYSSVGFCMKLKRVFARHFPSPQTSFTDRPWVNLSCIHGTFNLTSLPGNSLVCACSSNLCLRPHNHICDSLLDMSPVDFPSKYKSSRANFSLSYGLWPYLCGLFGFSLPSAAQQLSSNCIGSYLKL